MRTAATTSADPAACRTVAARLLRQYEVMSADDWNTRIITEFRANQGRVSGPFEGAPMVLVHHRGRKSGRDLVSPSCIWPTSRIPA